MNGITRELSDGPRLRSSKPLLVQLLACGWLIAGLASVVTAGAPEYMNLDYEVGQAFEIKGVWHESGYLQATDLEPLPRPRRPKLRGIIESVDQKNQSLTMFGLAIKVTDKTEFVPQAEVAKARLNLKAGQRVEVSCKVDDQGNWRATKVRTEAVKNSVKVKGTLTRVSVDGRAPDTLEINGLLIILDRTTDVNDPSSQIDQVEHKIFGHLSRTSPYGISGGHLFGEQFYAEVQYRQNIRSESEYDLDQGQQTDRFTTQPELRLKLSGYFGENLRGQAKFRFRKKFDVASDQDSLTFNGQTQVIEFYLLAKNIGGQGFALQVGRQDFDESREWLFDEYLDAIRGYYYGTKPILFEAAFIKAVEPIKSKLATWTDLFAQATWLVNRNSQASLYVLSRTDSDARNREPIWYGLRYSGVGPYNIKPWLELSFMKGEDKGKSLDAWAFDLGGTLHLPELKFKPAVTIAYAVGSGDDNASPEDNRFRQTGYQDDVDEFGGATSVPYYGAVLAPELSNLKIITLGAGFSPYKDGTIEFIYHSYQQHQLDNSIKGSDLTDPTGSPTGDSYDVGTAFDIIVSAPTFWDRAQISWTLGFFFPGQAFAPYLETANLSKLNLLISL